MQPPCQTETREPRCQIATVWQLAIDVKDLLALLDVLGGGHDKNIVFITQISVHQIGVGIERIGKRNHALQIPVELESVVFLGQKLVHLFFFFIHVVVLWIVHVERIAHDYACNHMEFFKSEKIRQFLASKSNTHVWNKSSMHAFGLIATDSSKDVRRLQHCELVVRPKHQGVEFFR
ncbi:hypothetical protein OGAPHI_003328 [Ogataea philodendri]|uniref:Uncharacterized protein n=1 Tax=Ogataea philodendri TaxID=1378263 RepID=A0A9P8P8G7_9ASCO|nr:uncharacterized protein OGAPHI_003328 [Ogataea philodendri]KAH3666879.1 hypothetical protein OGAPHI_003328 [Ogataea philodendri]